MSSDPAAAAPSVALNDGLGLKSDSLPGLQSPSKQQGQAHAQQRSGGAGDSKVLKLKGELIVGTRGLCCGAVNIINFFSGSGATQSLPGASVYQI